MLINAMTAAAEVKIQNALFTKLYDISFKSLLSPSIKGVCTSSWTIRWQFMKGSSASSKETLHS